MASTPSAVMDATLSHAWPNLLNVLVPVIGALYGGSLVVTTIVAV